MTYDPSYDPSRRVEFGGRTKPKRRVWPWVLAVVLGVIAFCGVASVLALGGGVKAVQHEQASRTADVKMTGCRKTVIGTVEISYTLTNSDTVGRTYLPEFQVKDTGGTIVGQATDITPEVGAGQSYKGKAVGSLDDEAGKFTCVLVSA